MLSALNELVEGVAHTLMAADAGNYVAASEQALTDVAAHFGLDVAFLRHNDHTIGATILIARQTPLDPVPLSVGLIGYEGLVGWPVCSQSNAGRIRRS